MAIRIGQYFGEFHAHPDLSRLYEQHAIDLLKKVNALMLRAEGAGVVFPINPSTNSQVSGATYGGFRPAACPIGAMHSKHKLGQAVDIYDPKNDIDTWCYMHQDILAECGIYLEHPSKTLGWSHWQSVAPAVTGDRVFWP